MFCPECGYKINENDSFCFACGSMLKKSVGDGRYSIIKILGKGGMGQVLLAHDNKMETDVVLKQLIPPKDDDSIKLDYLEKRMQEEAKLLYRLNYRGLPNVMDCFPENGNFFLVMQYIEGKTLGQIQGEEPEGKIEFAQAIRWMDKLLDILNFLHNHEPPIIHRDIKPQNIMIDKSGILYLVDFGIAIQMGSKGEYTRVGTYNYASPENFSGKFDITSDIYSLGATFHHLVTGLSPGEKIHPESFPPINRFIPDCPVKFQEIFKRMTAFNKDDRYKNCNEIRAELRTDPVMAGYLSGDEFYIQGELINNGISSPAKDQETTHRDEETVPDIPISQPPAVKAVPEKTKGEKVTGSRENMEDSSGNKKLNPVLIASIVVFIIALAAVIHFEIPLLMVPLTQVYTVKAYCSNMDSINRLREIAESRKLKYGLVRKIDYVTKDRRYVVLACFDSRPTAMIALNYMEKRGYKVSLGEKPDLGIFIHLDNDFSNREDAQEAADDFNKKVDVNYFSVAEIPIKEPVPGFEFIIPGLQSKRQANLLKNEFSPLSDKVEVIMIREKEDNSNEAG